MIEGYQTEELGAYDPSTNFRYFLEKLSKQIDRLEFAWETKIKAGNSYVAALDILGFFKQWVENNRGWEVILSADSKKREKITSELFTDLHSHILQPIILI